MYTHSKTAYIKSSVFSRALDGYLPKPPGLPIASHTAQRKLNSWGGERHVPSLAGTRKVGLGRGVCVCVCLDCVFLQCIPLTRKRRSSSSSPTTTTSSTTTTTSSTTKTAKTKTTIPSTQTHTHSHTHHIPRLEDDGQWACVNFCHFWLQGKWTLWNYKSIGSWHNFENISGQARHLDLPGKDRRGAVWENGPPTQPMAWWPHACTCHTNSMELMQRPFSLEAVYILFHHERIGGTNIMTTLLYTNTWPMHCYNFSNATGNKSQLSGPVILDQAGFIFMETSITCWNCDSFASTPCRVPWVSLVPKVLCSTRAVCHWSCFSM